MCESVAWCEESAGATQGVQLQSQSGSRQSLLGSPVSQRWTSRRMPRLETVGRGEDDHASTAVCPRLSPAPYQLSCTASRSRRRFDDDTHVRHAQAKAGDLRTPSLARYGPSSGRSSVAEARFGRLFTAAPRYVHSSALRPDGEVKSMATHSYDPPRPYM